MDHQVFCADRTAFADASDLIDVYGDAARDEAKQRASRSRELGNVVHFCRWREIDRLIGAMTRETSAGLLQ